MKKKHILNFVLFCCLVGVGAMDYLSFNRIPLSPIFSSLLLVLLMKVWPRGDHRDFWIVLAVKFLYLLYVTVVSLFRGYSIVENIYSLGSVWINLVTFIAFYKLFSLDKVMIYRVIRLLIIIVTFSNVVAILQHFQFQPAWALRNIFLGFETYASSVERNLNLYNLNYPVGLALSSVSLGTINSILLPAFIPYVFSLYRSRSRNRLFYILFLIICAVGLYVSRLRSGFVGFLFALLLIILRNLFSRRQYKIVSQPVLMIVVVTMVVTVIVFNAFDTSGLDQRYDLISGSSTVMEDARFQNFTYFWDVVFMGFPGYGFTSLGRQEFGFSIGWHNQLLIIASQGSLIAIALFVSLIIWMLSCLFRFLKYQPRDPMLSSLAFNASIGLLVSGLFNSLFHNINYLTQDGLVPVLLALLCACSRYLQYSYRAEKIHSTVPAMPYQPNPAVN
jgi:hypothetical protein